MTWDEDQKFEREWWGTCANTFSEENKQITYAHRMGLVNQPQGEFWPVYDLQKRSVIDVGGGPVSMLLKCRNPGRLVVVDPCDYPHWVKERYTHMRIAFMPIKAEEYQLGDMPKFDEAWIYNCLQHTIDPEKIVANARLAAHVVRIFEWVDIPPCPGHPQELKADKLDSWLSGRGTVEVLRENGCYGKAYYGVFGGK